MAEYNTHIQEYRAKQNELLGSKEDIERIRNRRREPLPSAHLINDETPLHVDAYRQILACDFDSASWIKKDEAHRKHRKNINKNYKSLTGSKTDLGDVEQKKRKMEFEQRRNLSLEASMKMQEVLEATAHNQLGASDQDFLAGLAELDLSQFKYKEDPSQRSSGQADRDFLENFKDQMIILHHASLIYQNQISGNLLGGQELTSEQMDRLAFLNEARQAYEDRIRIISSPYYVSLREKDFDKATKKHLEKKGKDQEEKASLRSYAKAVLRWQERGKSILSETDASKRLKSGRIFHSMNMLPMEENGRTYASDTTVDKVIRKISPRVFSWYLNGGNDQEDQEMIAAKNWIWQDLGKSVKKTSLLGEVDRMRKELERRLREPGEVTSGSKRELYEKMLRHLARVSRAFSEGKISKEAMRLWLDRCLQYNLPCFKKIYFNLVFQSAGTTDEKDYYNKTALVMDKYMKNLKGGVIFSQSDVHGEENKTVYQNEEDIAPKEENKAEKEEPEQEEEARRKRALLRGGKEHPFKGIENITKKGGGFIHVNGKNADPNDVSTRAYISAKPKYKSMAVKLFTDTVKELGLADQLYFKFTTGKAIESKGFGRDDLTVFFGSNLTKEEKKHLLDEFYVKCRTAGDGEENILSDEDMSITGYQYQEGITLAGEPVVASTMNSLFSNARPGFKAAFSDRIRLMEIDPYADEKGHSQYSYNTFIAAMLVQSAFAAAKQMGKKRDGSINVAATGMLPRIKKLFRELCFLNGINPENMSEIDSMSIFGQ